MGLCHKILKDIAPLEETKDVEIRQQPWTYFKYFKNL